MYLLAPQGQQKRIMHRERSTWSYAFPFTFALELCAGNHTRISCIVVKFKFLYFDDSMSIRYLEICWFSPSSLHWPPKYVCSVLLWPRVHWFWTSLSNVDQHRHTMLITGQCYWGHIAGEHRITSTLIFMFSNITGVRSFINTPLQCWTPIFMSKKKRAVGSFGAVDDYWTPILM